MYQMYVTCLIIHENSKGFLFIYFEKGNKDLVTNINNL